MPNPDLQIHSVANDNEHDPNEQQFYEKNIIKYQYWLTANFFTLNGHIDMNVGG